MNIQEITQLRLSNQQISGSYNNSLPEIVRHMGAMQAQDYYGTLWALGLRSGQTEKDIITAFENGGIVRTWPQRGTLHVVPAEDAKWMVGLSADRLLRGAKRRREQLGLDDSTLVKCEKVLVKALQGNKPMTRPKVMDALEQAGISTKSGRGYHILWYLSQTGITIVGPMEGKQQTFALLDDWVPHSETLTRDEGIAVLAGRYFKSHGPATIQDFMWWSGLTKTDATAGLAANKPVLSREKVDQKEYWFPNDRPSPDSPDAFLLPGFDEYMLGYKDRSAILHADHSNKIVPGGNGVFFATIVIDGQIVGTWKRIIKKEQVHVEFTPFKRLTKSEMKLLEEPSERYRCFLGLPSLQDYPR